ncbi:antichymotrypsin-2-like isoform X2 [Plodia interpunctella]
MAVSTLPLRLALNKLAVAADGQTREQLMTILGVDDVKDLPKFFPRLENQIKCLRDSDLIMLNKIYVNQSDALSPSFFADSYHNFGVQVEKINFSSQNPDGVVHFVNDWIEADSFKRITNLLSNNDIKRHYNMILVNAIHMKPTWEKTFDIRMSVMKPFQYQNLTESAPIRMMTEVEKDFYYYQDSKNKFQVLMIHLLCDGCKITYFLPNKVTGLPQLLSLLTRNPDIMQNAVKNLKMETLNVRLPVMKMKNAMNWNAYLHELGARKMFDYKSSGLDSMAQSTNYFLGKAIQKVFLEVDEFGVHRVAPHVPIALPEFKYKHTIPQFVADHPFFFKVEIEENGISHELLSGVFYGPEEDSLIRQKIA